jgi:hypothetical protein
MPAVLTTAFWAAAQNTQPSGPFEIDACGTLVRGVECVLFETGGARYFLANYGRFRVGDKVRVVGTVNPDCVTICGEGDGCVQGAVLYDPAVFPCGTDLPDLPGDICAAAAAGLAGLAAGGMYLSGRRRSGRG